MDELAGNGENQESLEALGEFVSKNQPLVRPALPSGESRLSVLSQDQPSESFFDEDSGLPDRQGWWKRKWRTILGWAVLGACSITVVVEYINGTINKLIAKPFGVNVEFFKQQQAVKSQGEDITQNLVRQAQKEGEDFGDNFDIKTAKQEGADLVERTYQDMSRLFDEENTASKVEPALVKLIIKNPLVFESNQTPATNFNLIFNQRDWSIAQKLYMESLAIAAAEKGIIPNNDGLEQWLFLNEKDSVYSLKVDGQTVDISGAHLLQILWNEYKSADNWSMTAEDQQLFLQYWQARGTIWITPEGKIEEEHKLSRSEVQQIFDMAEKIGADPAEVLGNVFTLQEEAVFSSGSVEIRALDMAQATMGVASVDNITGAVLGLMVVFGFGRLRLSTLMSGAGTNIDKALQIATQAGQELLEKFKIQPGIKEEISRQENSRRLVNRLRHGLSLSREFVLDLGSILFDPDNPDMKDLILTEGVNWFRHVPENHPETRQIMSFFGCENYQELQILAKSPALIPLKLEQLLTLKIKEYRERGRGRERGLKLKTQKILPENARRLVELYQSLTG